MWTIAIVLLLLAGSFGYLAYTRGWKEALAAVSALGIGLYAAFSDYIKAVF